MGLPRLCGCTRRRSTAKLLLLLPLLAAEFLQPKMSPDLVEFFHSRIRDVDDRQSRRQNPPTRVKWFGGKKSVEEVYQHCWNHRFDALLDSCNGIEDWSVDRARQSMQQAALEFAGEFKFWIPKNPQRKKKQEKNKQTSTWNGLCLGFAKQNSHSPSLCKLCFGRHVQTDLRRWKLLDFIKFFQQYDCCPISDLCFWILRLHLHSAYSPHQTLGVCHFCVLHGTRYMSFLGRDM